MAKQVQIFEIEFDVDEANKKVEKAAGLMEALKEQQKEVSKEFGKGSEQYRKTTEELNRASQIYRTTKRDIEQIQKAQKAATGSIEEQRLKLAILKKQWVQQGTETKEGKKRQAELGMEVRKLTDSLKAQEKAVGDNRRNVGNYAESMEEAIESSGGLAGSAINLVKNMKPLQGVLLGVGAAFTGVVKGMSRTEEGTRNLAKVQGGAKLVWDGFLQTLGNWANQAIEATGILDSQNHMVNRMLDSVAKLVTAEEDLALAEAKRATREKEFLKLQEDQRQIRDDESLSIQERIAANEELGRLQQEQLEEELELANEALEIAQLRIRVEGDSIQNQIKEQEALQRIADIQERINGQQSEQLVNLNSLRREQAALAQEEQKRVEKEIKEQEKKQAEFIRQQEAANDNYIELQDELYKLKLTDIEREEQAVAEKYDRLFQLAQESGLKEAELAKVQADLIEQQESEIHAMRMERINAEAEAQKAADEEEMQRQAAIQTARLTRLNAILSATQSLRQLAAEGTEDERAAALIENTVATALGATQAYAGAQVLGPIAGPIVGGILAAAMVEVGRRNHLKITQAAKGMNLFPDGTKRYDIGGKLHSEGGTTFYDQYGNPQFEAERGETAVILNRKASGILGRLSDLNEATGGIPLMEKGGIAYMADGGVLVGGGPQNYGASAPDIADALASMQLFVSVQEINDVNSRLQVIENRSQAT